MSQRERDVLKVMAPVLKGQRTQTEAARLLGRSVRQVRRLQQKLKTQGDSAVVHGLRGRLSNRALGQAVRREVVSLYRQQYAGFGPALAAEKLAERDALCVKRETLRRWLLAEGLWRPSRRCRILAPFCDWPGRTRGQDGSRHVSIRYEPLQVIAAPFGPPDLVRIHSALREFHF